MTGANPAHARHSRAPITQGARYKLAQREQIYALIVDRLQAQRHFHRSARMRAGDDVELHIHASEHKPSARFVRPGWLADQYLRGKVGGRQRGKDVLGP